MLLKHEGNSERYGAYLDEARSAHARQVSRKLASGATGGFGLVQRAAGGIWSGIRRARAAVQRAQRRRAAIRELERLDDRILADIGVPRSQIRILVDRHLAAAATRPPEAGQPRLSTRDAEARKTSSGDGGGLKRACC